MSLETNKKDFEGALAQMKETIELLNHCVDDSLMDTLNGVVNEYEGHLSRDIEEIQSKVDDLQEKLDDHES